MKILQLTCHFRPNVGGVETHLDDLVGELSKRGNKVFVLTYRPLTYRTTWKMFEEGNNFSILRIPWFAGLFYKLVKDPFLEFLYLLPGLFFMTPLILICFNPKVIHAHGLVAGFIGVFWGKVFGKRAITTTHSVYEFPNKGIYRNFAKWIFNNSDHILTLSRQSKSEIEKLGVNAKKITVFTYWIDFNKFVPVKNAKEKLRWNNKFVVLFVGRLVEEKGVLVLLKSVEKWNKGITLVIIGTGPLEANVKRSQNVNNNIIFLGKVDNHRLPLYFSGADLLLVPSVSEEGFGRVILESFACGTPVIGSNRGAISEALDKSVGGLVNPTTVNIKRTIEYFYENRNKLKNLSVNTVDYCKRKFSSKNVQTILSTYE